MDCEYCNNIFGVEDHKQEDCFAHSLYQHNMSFCWHCYRLDKLKKIEEKFCHYHKTKYCTFMCHDLCCKMNGTNHAKFDCGKLNISDILWM